MLTNVTQSSYSSRSSYNGFAGFTLLEVMLTVGLALMVIGLTFTTLYYSAKASREARINTNVDFELMKIYAQMRQQLLNMYIPRDQSAPVKGRKTKDEHRDELYFFTASPVMGKGIVEAAYAIKGGDTGTPYLAYREFACQARLQVEESDDNPAIKQLQEEKWRTLSPGIRGLSLQFTEKEAITEEWDTNRVPQKIEVTLWYTADREDRGVSFTVTPGLYEEATGQGPATASPAASPAASPEASAAAPAGTPTATPTRSNQEKI